MVRSVETDVLVMGGGSAGMCAALAARAAGRRVVLVYKSGGNCTSVAEGAFAAVLPGTSDDDARRHGENTLASGAGLADEALVALLTEGGGAALQGLMALGIEFQTAADGTLRRFRSGGHDRARTYRCGKGNLAQFFRTLSARMREAGVEPLKDCAMAGLLRSGRRVCGAWGMDAAGQPLKILAKAVVLATGGFAGAFRNRTAPSGLTGDGHAMAYAAGARLMDLEFVQFMPTTLAFPPEFQGRVVSDALRGEGAVLLNSAGERFMARYAPVLGECAGRDVLAVAIATEVAEGRGTPHGGAYLDATGLDEATLCACWGSVRQLIARGLDPRTMRLEVAPAAHFTCGGVCIDAGCATGVEGLYAAGEVTAGVHGANRLGANALTSTLVFGGIAGRSAADWAGSVAGPGEAGDPEQDRLARDSRPPADRRDTALDAIDQEARQVLWEHVGVARTRDGLDRAVSRLRDLEHALAAERPGAYTYRENMQRLRLGHMLLLGGLAARAAAERRESRGNHYRLDFPERDEAFLRHTVFAGPDRA